MRRLCTVGALALSVNFAAPAQGAIPVIDLRAIAQQIAQLRAMAEDFGIQTDILDNALEQFGLLQDQLDRLQSLYDSLTGAREVIQTVMDEGLNGLLDGGFSDVLGAIRGVQTGDWSALAGPNAGRLQGAMEDVLMAAGFDPETLDRLASGYPRGGAPASPDPDDPTGPTGVDTEAQRIAARATGGAAMTATAQVSYENAGQGADRIERLVAAIADQPDLKASIDHNTRVTAELGLIMLESLRLQSVAGVGEGQAAVIEAANRAAEREYLDFTLPDME